MLRKYIISRVFQCHKSDLKNTTIEDKNSYLSFASNIKLNFRLATISASKHDSSKIVASATK